MLETELFRVGAYVFTVQATASLAVGLGLGVVGVATLVLERSSQEGVAFFLLAVAAGLWLQSFAWMYAAPDAGAAERWARAAYLGVPLIPAAAYRFSLRIRSLRSPLHRTLDAVFWGVGLVLALLAVATDLTVSGVRRYTWGWFPRFPATGLLTALFTAGGLGAAVTAFWRGWQSAPPGEERRRFGHLVLAFGVGAVALLDYLPAFGVEVVPIGYLFVAGFLTLIARTVTRYRFVRYTPAFAAESVLETLADPLVVCDARDCIRLVNDAVREKLGFRLEELRGQPVEELAGESEAAREALVRAVRMPRVRSRELTLQDRDGDTVEVSLSTSPLEDLDGVRVGSVLVARDIRRRKAVEREAERRAREDALTGLANRRRFREAVTRTLDEIEREGRPTSCAVIHVGLTRFSAVNDALGHAAGDRVLQEVARRLMGEVRDTDLVARVGGDEFACLVRGGPDRRELEEMAARIEGTLREPLRIEGAEVPLRAAVGLATGEPDRFGPDDLIRAATLAERRAREEGEGPVRHRFFDPERDGAITERLHRENEFRRALREGELFPVYQPLVALEDGRVTGLEALVRWRHPERGTLTPGAFLELAEDLGLMDEVGRQVLDAVCRRAARWSASTDPGGVPVGVNLSAVELADPGLPERLRSTLEDAGLPAEALIVELTESTAIEHTDRLDAISELGVTLALDDFGTGFSSLAYLARLPFDLLKLDRTFVARLEDDEPTRAVVRAVVDVAHELDVRVVAEGIETAGQAAAVRELGCRMGQGFHFARPIEADEVESVLRARGVVDRAAS